MRELAEGAHWARKTYSVGERFGTLGVVLADGETVEVSRYRPDALDAIGNAARFGLDAEHRDFTVNAIALDLTDGAILDPLSRRPVPPASSGPPAHRADRFAEDPLRITSPRFVSELGFQVESANRGRPAAGRRHYSRT